MLKLQKIYKEYKTGGLLQTALNDVSLDLRDSEFVAVLGPSGSGKTTLLNIIGGLDRYDSGDLIINGISTRKYSDRDWDAYRSHTIGFVFQSYNLIPHQTVLANVELALTISGVSGPERRARAVKALKQVGLGSQLHKLPAQLSGGQMQRVAIARALVNDPDILLADEPTGALDSETSVQVMELLKEVASDRLVVMVTHNPELAERYATRIVRLNDGRITSDTDPCVPSGESLAEPVHKSMGHTSMSLLTSLSLSFNNLRTKKARTLLTAFAGSIGIIGIALIISLSEGVNSYITEVESATLSEYPLQILSSGMDITTLLSAGLSGSNISGAEEGTIPVQQLITKMVSGFSSNDLRAFKAYLESEECTIDDDASSIEYYYGAVPQIYRLNADGSARQVNPDSSLAALGISSSSSTNSLVSSVMNTSVFYQLPANTQLYETQYDVKAGHWPQAPNECTLVLGSDGSVTDYTLYALGLRDAAELDNMILQFAQNQSIDIPNDFKTYTYSDFLGLSFKLVNSSARYVYDETYGIWKDKSDDAAFMQALVQAGQDLTITGIVQPKSSSASSMLISGIAYSASLTQQVIAEAAQSQIVQAQLAAPQTNILTGAAFGTDSSGTAFDLSALFSVDSAALQSAFTLDDSALSLDLSEVIDLNGDVLDLTQLIDPDSLKPDLSSLPGIDADAIFKNLNLTISSAKLDALAQKVLEGYKDYVAESGIINLSKLSFSAYLQSSSFRQLLNSSIKEIFDSAEIEKQFTSAIKAAMEDYSEQLASDMQSQMNAAMQQAAAKLEENLQSTVQQSLEKLSGQMESALKVDVNAFKNAVKLNMSDSELSELIRSAMLSSSSTYENNLLAFGYADLSSPSQINIYPRDFESKAAIISKLDAYNSAMEAQGEEGKTISCTDIVGTLMSSVTQIVEIIGKMLIAFVSIALVVSSIMIGVITYISVLERRKEIGILRALGASRRNVSDVFNAETFIIGLSSGIMGIVLSELLLIPGNILINALASTGSAKVTAALPLSSAAVLIALSTVLTMLAGWIPSKSAAKSNPVAALRSE